MASKFKSGAEFWPHYLATHTKPTTRAVHYAGTGLGIIAATACVFASAPLLLGIGITLVSIFGPLFASHAIFEKKAPATFDSFRSFPWAIKSELKMVALWVAGLWSPGRLKKEYDKYGIDFTGKAAPKTETTKDPAIQPATPEAAPAAELKADAALANTFNAANESTPAAEANPAEKPAKKRGLLKRLGF